MNCRLLCPGPSLARYEPGDFATRLSSPKSGMIIGVNRAAIAFACDAWAALDPSMVRSHHRKVIGAPVLVTSRDVPPLLAREQIHWRGRVCPTHDLFAFVPHPVNYVLYSATTALVYAAFCGATKIDVFGCDWQGTLDWDGTAAGKNRTPDRWTSEKHIWAATLDALRAKGVSVSINH